MNLVSMRMPWGVLFFVTLVLALFLCAAFLWTDAGRKTAVGRFFSFEKLYLETVLKVLYIFCAVFFTVLLCAFVLVFADYLSEGLLFALFVFVCGQFLLRLVFESSIAFIRLAIDVRGIRNALAESADFEYRGDSPNRSDVDIRGAAATAASLVSVAASGVSNLASKGAEHARGYAEAYRSTQQGSTSANMGKNNCSTWDSADAGLASPGSPLESDARWDCVCGASGNKGEFCGFCGRPRQ